MNKKIKDSMKQIYFLSAMLLSVVLYADVPEQDIEQKLMDFFSTSDGQQIVQKALEERLTRDKIKQTVAAVLRKTIQKEDLLADEVKYAVVRFLHTPEGKQLVQNIVEKNELKAEQRPCFLDKETVKFIALSALGVWAFRSLENGLLKRGIVILVLAKAFGII